METRDVDGIGFLETVSTKGKGNKKGKNKARHTASSRRKAMQKPKYVFVQAIKNDAVYKDYFNADPDVEKKMLKLSELVSPPLRIHWTR